MDKLDNVIAQDPKFWAEQVENETSARVHVIAPGESISI